MTILITGGTGFLGSYFTRYAIQQGELDRVVIFDRYIDRARIADVIDHVTIVEGDIADFDAVRSAVEGHGVDRIAHFASILGTPLPGQVVPFVGVQCLGTAHVYEAARLAGVSRVLFCSSVAAYGRQEGSPLTEDMIPNPMEPYGASKAWAESLGRFYAKAYGLDVVTVRFGSTYGLGRAWRGSYNSQIIEPPSESHYMARIEDAVRGKQIVLPRADAIADWTYAGDAAQAVWRALTADHLSHDLYNVSAERRPIGDFAKALQALLPAAQITFGSETPGNEHPPLDSSRIRRDLDFSPAFTLLGGVRDYIERIHAYDDCSH